jgi:hypothetical protein
MQLQNSPWEQCQSNYHNNLNSQSKNAIAPLGCIWRAPNFASPTICTYASSPESDLPAQRVDTGLVGFTKGFFTVQSIGTIAGFN